MMRTLFQDHESIIHWYALLPNINDDNFVIVLCLVFDSAGKKYVYEMLHCNTPVVS